MQRLVLLKDDGTTSPVFMSEDGRVFETQESCMSHEWKRMEDSWEKESQKYISDPNTRVFINHNNETGRWWYSVEVYDSGGFWLDSFKTLEEAKRYISDNSLFHDLQGDVL